MSASLLRRLVRLAFLCVVVAIGATDAADAAGAPDVPLPSEADAETRAWALYRAARSAYQRGDHTAFLATTRQALALVPDDPTLLVDEARGAALTGQPAAALQALARLATLGLEVDIAHADFAALRPLPAFVEVTRRLAAVTTPVGSSTVAFRLAEKDLLTEGIAHDPTTGTSYVTSVRRRKIVAVDKSGAARDFVPPQRDGLLAPLGIAVDPPRRRLWAATTAVPPMDGYTKADEGRAALVCFDLESGRIRRQWSPPDSSIPHNVNDVVVAPSGDVYVSDSSSGAVYRVRAEGEALEILVPPGRIRSPNGLALLPDGRQLVVADYVRGLVRVDTATGAVSTIVAPPDVLLSGIDGLVRVDERLVAIQNGIRPHRLLALRLDATGNRVLEARLLARALPEFDEPTLGVAVGTELLYIANSEWGAYDGEGRLTAPERLRPATILRLRLD